MSTDEYIIVIGDVSAAEKWKGGGESLLLSLLVWLLTDL